MLMRLNWGQGLLIFFIVFISILVFVVIKSTTISRDLVRDDYYSLDINYQERYDQIENRKKLERDLVFRYNSKESCLLFDFGPVQLPVSFSVRMYRVAGSKQEDQLFRQETHSSVICVPLEDLNTGKWVAEVTWNDGALTYFKEDRILISSK